MRHAFEEKVKYGGGVVLAILAQAVHRRLSSVVSSFGVNVGFGEKHFDHGDVAFLHRKMKSIVQILVNSINVNPLVN